jgi:hypothetical protein
MTDASSSPPRRRSLGIETRMKWLNDQPTWLKTRVVIGALMVAMYFFAGDHLTGAISVFARVHPSLPDLLVKAIGVCGVLILAHPEREYCVWLTTPLFIFILGLFEFLRLSLLKGDNASHLGAISNLGLYVIAWFAMQRSTHEH